MAEKSCTSIKQSKILAEILPIGSADMYYSKYDTIHANTLYGSCDIQDFNIREYIPCWSLAALLGILAEQDFRINAIGNKFNIDIPIRHCKIWFSSLVDAAFEMVVWLKKNGKI